MVKKKFTLGRMFTPGYQWPLFPSSSSWIPYSKTWFLQSFHIIQTDVAWTGCCGQSQFWLPVIWCKGETNQQLSRFLFLWPSSWHSLSYSTGVKAFSKQCCPCDTKKVSAHMLNLLLLGILPHRESVKLSLWTHLYSHCFQGETHQYFILE